MNRVHRLSAMALVAGAVSISVAASAQDAREFAIPPGSLGDALNLFAAQSDQQIMFSGDLVAGLRTDGLRGRHIPSDALGHLLRGSGLMWSETRPGVIYLRRGSPRAQAAGEAVTALEDVIVTGTLLRTSGQLASPLVTLSRDDLDRRAAGTVAEALIALPQNYAGASTPISQAALSDTGGSNNVFATGVNLRGLGPASTLVLVNGRRLAGTGSRAEFADISALPSAAVERVDVLLDGASALYGADAVAGVVNVIMRRSFDGHESRVRASAAKGGAEDVQASHIVGGGWSSGAAYLSYEYQSAKAFSTSDRPYTANGDLRPFGGTDHRGFYSAPGNIVAFNPATSSYGVQYAIRPNASGSVQGPADFVAGETNRQSGMLGVDLLPELQRHSAYGRVSQSLGDRVELTADVRYSLRTTDLATAPSAGIFTVTRANPWFVSPTGAASHTVAYSFVRDIGPARSHTESESLGATLGVRVDLSADWSAEAYLAEATEKADFGNSNRVNSRYLAEALGAIPDDPATPYRAAVDGYFNLFSQGGANSRAVLDFIASGYGEVHNRSRSRSANILVQGPLTRLPGGDLSVAIGAQLRDERFDTRGLTFLSGAAPLPFSSPRAERSISAAFVEARIPIVGPDNARPGIRRLDLSVAGRIEDYDDFGTTTNPKIGLVWSPLEAIVVRSSWGTSFRAGALAQLFDAPGVSPTFLDRADGSEALILMVYGGNADLKPETSETFTAGIDFRPRDGTSLSLNYFDTRFEDRIAQPVNANFRGALVDPTLRPFVTFVDPANRPADRALIEAYAGVPGYSTLFPVEAYGALVDTRWVNTGSVRIRGLDVTARSGWSVGDGRVMAETNLSWILDYENQTTPTAIVEEVAGLIGYPAELRARTGLTWSRGGVQAGAYWNHVAGQKDRLGAQIDAWDTVDARLAWSPGRDGDGLQIELAVQNLTDEDPPFYDASTGLGFDPGQANPLGRVVSLQLTRRW
ncbi:outer membrane receptor protein involved in Fe transport [Brevundimonas sp. UYEF29]|uniref:TonB-dependent receptor n=1 Tax=Brevundimonas TaxID=41275 RepID=UPI003399E42A